METLKDKIIDEGKRILVSSIPFAVYTKKGNEIMTKDNKNWEVRNGPLSAKNKSYVGLNVVSACVGIFGIFYTVGALASGTNPLEPKKVLSGMVTTNEEERQQSDEKFYEIDTNGDYLIDPNEFFKYRHPHHH